MKSYSWFEFIGIFILLIGIYAAVHTAINFALPNYPQSGVLAINTSGSPFNIQRVSDCNYARLYYEPDGIILRQPTATEKKQDKMDKDRCLAGITELVQEVKMADISVSVLFLFVGLGLLFSTRFLKK